MSVATVDPTDTLAVLKAAREWLSDPARWTQRVHFRDADGGLVCDPSNAAQACAEGALVIAAGLGDQESWRPINPARRAFEDAAGGHAAPYVNDRCGYKAVLVAYDKAIAKLESEA